jgi:S1-C subfamily serine protease
VSVLWLLAALRGAVCLAAGRLRGPLFNDEGKVIGINFAKVRQFGGPNFAIPVGFGKTILDP